MTNPGLGTTIIEALAKQLNACVEVLMNSLSTTVSVTHAALRAPDHCRGRCGIFGKDSRVPTHARARAFLESVAKRRILISYQELANALEISPPHSINRVTEALERLMEEDASAHRPFIAALVISKACGGLPRPGFFDCARRLARFAGDPDGQDARTFHATELNAVSAFWGGSGDD